MATWVRSCNVNKCEISACAVCHCCQKDLCLDHLKEHRDKLNSELAPLTNHINTHLDTLEHFTPTSLPIFKVLEQWRIKAHETVDQFYEHLRQELFEQKKNQPLEKLRTIRNTLEQLIRKQGATRENIASLTNDIQLIEQDINSLQNIQISLRPLVIDRNTILQSNCAAENNQTNKVFQIFVQSNTSHTPMLITIEPTDTIKELKLKIQKREGISPDQQRLTYIGKMLRDDYTLITYDIQPGSTIQLSLIFKLKNDQ